MPDEKETKGAEVDAGELKELAKKDPKSKKYNNPNSRKNLKQYQDKDQPNYLTPEVLDEDDAEGLTEEVQAEEIVRGRKLSIELVKKLIPKRDIFTAHEKKRFVGIVTQFLTDFKNEEPTASDIEDIFEIAKADVLEMRVLQATKNDPTTLIASSQFLDKIHKRKQSAKQNLANRRSDRVGARDSQDLNIVDLVVNYDLQQKKAYEDKVEELLASEKKTRKELREVLEKDGY